MNFTDPQIILFVADCERSSAFYATFGFTETFRTTPEAPVKLEMTHGGTTLGFAQPGPAASSHDIDPVSTRHRACFTIWTDDIDAARGAALTAGATDRSAPHPYLDGELTISMLEDPDGHPIQLVQRSSSV